MNQENLESSHNSRQWAMVCHLAGFLGWVFPLGNIIGTLALWLIKKKEYSFVNIEGKESLNCQLSFTVYTLIFGLVGVLAVMGMMLFNLQSAPIIYYVFFIIYSIFGALLFSTYIISMIVAAIKTYKGNSFRYPFIIRFIK